MPRPKDPLLNVEHFRKWIFFLFRMLICSAAVWKREREWDKNSRAGECSCGLVSGARATMERMCWSSGSEFNLKEISPHLYSSLTPTISKAQQEVFAHSRCEKSFPLFLSCQVNPAVPSRCRRALVVEPEDWCRRDKQLADKLSLCWSCSYAKVLKCLPQNRTMHTSLECTLGATMLHLIKVSGMEEKLFPLSKLTKRRK